MVAYKSINWHADVFHEFYQDERQRYLLADFFCFVNIRLQWDYYLLKKSKWSSLIEKIKASSSKAPNYNTQITNKFQILIINVLNVWS
jgi:hypothetical protein